MYKKKLVKGYTIEVTHRCSAIMDSKLAKKKDDLRAFTIPCTIGMHEFVKALCELGVRINLMTFFIYNKLRLDAPKPNSMQLLMEDSSIKRPVGILFDVLVKVDKFVLLADIVVLDCEIYQEVPIIIGCPLLSTIKAILDLYMGEIKFRAQEDEVAFKICKTNKKTLELQVLFLVDVESEKVNKDGIDDLT
ncbi:uncharacterized protein LOC124888929 [Capsicum annuum]|uniref:uncharacterized protein LOC124888929 n=1 Tax=Capsicum annuum TaxID=4072 RepID=UPI001FB05914|nr:uncharacterized protein LOC124888929 [Capsicum annuum]